MNPNFQEKARETFSRLDIRYSGGIDDLPAKNMIEFISKALHSSYLDGLKRALWISGELPPGCSAEYLGELILAEVEKEKQ